MCGHRDPLVAGGCYSVFDSSGTVAVLGGWGGSCLVDGTCPRQEVPANRGGSFCMSARTRTDILPYIFLIPVCGYFLPGTSMNMILVTGIIAGKISKSKGGKGAL